MCSLLRRWCNFCSVHETRDAGEFPKTGSTSTPMLVMFLKRRQIMIVAGNGWHIQVARYQIKRFSQHSLFPTSGVGRKEPRPPISHCILETRHIHYSWSTYIPVIVIISCLFTMYKVPRPSPVPEVGGCILWDLPTSQKGLVRLILHNQSKQDYPLAANMPVPS